MTTTLIAYGLAAVGLILSAIRSREKTKIALKKAWKGLYSLIPALTAMLLFIAISFSLIDETLISHLIGGESGLVGVLLGLLLGSLLFLPGFVALPLGANLIHHGAGMVQIAAFVGSLIGVGLLSLPIEIKYFGRRTAIVRNMWGLIAASVFSLLVWMIL